MNFKDFTDEQKKAIKTIDKNVLVSAAAGSGKTAVLVERVKYLIIEKNKSIKNMLIVTFTKAAASEMKEKILNALKDEIKNSKDETLISRLKEEIDLIPNANISTFHNFSMEVIKRFYYLIGIEPNLKAMDEAEGEIILNESIDEIIENYFEEENKEFLDFIDGYTNGKDLNEFKEILTFMYKKILALDEPYIFLDSSLEKFKYTENDLVNSVIFDKAKEIGKKRINLLIKELNEYISFYKENNIGNGGAELRVKEVIEELNIYLSHLDRLDFDYLMSSNININRFSKKKYLPDYENDDEEYLLRKKELDNIIKRAKELVKKLKEAFFYDTPLNLAQVLNSSYDSHKFLVDAIIRLDTINAKKKLDKGLMSFDDMQRFSYEILKFDEASSYYKNKFKYIFIDEYQDTNGVQSAIVDMVKGDKNLFMVGDVKQSIYRFRNADPNLFKQKYIEFSKEEETSTKIDLNKNFRSKEEIIDFTNSIFLDIMENYDDKEKLYFGKKDVDEENQDVKLFVIKKKNEDLSEIDKIISDLKKEEREAILTAGLIRDLVEKKGYKYKDIRILLRAVKTQGTIFYHILNQKGIGAYIDDSDGYFETIEINTMLSLLKIIDNENRDLDLLTIMRSEMFGFSISDLTEIRINGLKEQSYYLAIKKYIRDGEDKLLKEKCINMIEMISKFREYTSIYPLEELIFKVMLETNFYILVGALPVGRKRQANLRYLVDKAKEYRTSIGGNLYGFINYLEIFKKSSTIKSGQVKMVSQGEDVVTISTIHVSKGLQFPVVIIPGYNGNINYGTGGNVEFCKEIGFSLDYVNFSGHYKQSTIIKNLIKEINKEEEIEEAKRVLYVALTRAEEVLYLISYVDDVENIYNNLSGELRSSKTFLTMTGKTIVKRKDKYIRVIDDKKLEVEIKKGRNIKKILEVLNSKPNDVPSDFNEKVNFKMEYSNVKVKESVTGLNKKEEQELKLEFPIHKEREEFNKAEIGTIMHKVLYEMDFLRARNEGKSYLDYLLTDLVKKEILLPNELNVVDINLLLSFSESELVSRIIKSDRVYKEKSFTYKNEEGILIQGIIDLFFIEDNEIVLIDYKTTGKKDINEIKETYSSQIALYKDAITKALKLNVKESYLYLINQNKLMRV